MNGEDSLFAKNVSGATGQLDMMIQIFLHDFFSDCFKMISAQYSGGRRPDGIGH